jgi:hypothetical protein
MGQHWLRRCCWITKADVDIKIDYTGLSFEELLNEEGITATKNKKYTQQNLLLAMECITIG